MLGNRARLCLPGLNLGNRGLLPSRVVGEPRTHLATTQPLGRLYEPRLPARSDLRHLSEPTPDTDAHGALHPSVEADPPPRRTAAGER